MAVSAGVDAVGFVGVGPDSPRTQPDDVIATIIAALPPAISSFLLTAKTTAREISEQITRTHATVVQISRPIDLMELEQLAVLKPQVKRVKVIHVRGLETLDEIAVYEPYVDGFLLDSGSAIGSSGQLGGTGQVHDWNVSKGFIAKTVLPVFLAGGLLPTNVREAIKRVGPYGVDLCSGVRTDGHLDEVKLNQFVSAVHSADVCI